MAGRDESSGQAWALFYLEHRQMLGTYALSLTGNAHDAEDLIQDILVRMVQDDRSVRSAKPYVLRCIRNRVIDCRRAAQVRPSFSPLDDAAVGFIDKQLDDSTRRESTEKVRSALLSIDPNHREVIVLKVYCDLTFKEIAKILGQPLGTVTSHYARGITKLRTSYEQETSHA